MQKWIRMIVATILVLSLGVAFAEEQAQMKSDDQKSGMKESTMMGQGMMGQGMMGQGMMKQRMMGSMMEKKLVATQDGGVVVLIGNKLSKYDKDLKLVKEVDLKIDMPQMGQMMMGNEEEEGCPGGGFHADYPYHHLQKK